MVWRWFLTLLIAIASLPAIAAKPLDHEGLQAALDAALDSHLTAKRTTVTLKVLDVASGDVLYDRGGDRLLTPASNLKIYTSACALDTFGADHRFKTSVGSASVMRNGHWNGDLVLIGGGDAMLSSKDLATLADRAVQEMHVKSVRGTVVVDNSRYGNARLGPGWMWDDEPSDYSMAVTPLMLDFNAITVKLLRDSLGFEARLEPPAEYPPIVRTESDDTVKEPTVTRSPFADEVLVTGGARLKKSIDVKLSVNDPGRWAAAVFERMLRDRGVEFLPAEGAKPSLKTSAMLEHEGLTLAETLKHFNHMSENAVGEVLLHEIAIAKGVKRPDWPDGAKVISRWLVERAGLEEGSFRLVDGSGLSRYNQISADSSVRLLKYLHGSEHFDVFFASLPKEKVDGDEIVSCKGGSMSSVSTVSGYIKTDSGRTLAFSMLANGFLGDNKPVFDLRQCVWREMRRYEP